MTDALRARTDALRARDVRVEPISSRDARRIVRALHYSGTVCQNSQLNYGVFARGRCGGALQFGPPLDRRRMLWLVEGSRWENVLELNRMALADWLPRNSESRALGFVFRAMRRDFPQIKWVLSFADAIQCGDGAIYRATGFVLTAIRENQDLRRNPATGEVVHHVTIKTSRRSIAERQAFKSWPLLAGVGLRYIKFLDPTWRDRLTVPVIPFSELDRRGLRMYRGRAIPSVRGDTGDTAGHHPDEGGSIPTRTLQDETDRASAIR